MLQHVMLNSKTASLYSSLNHSLCSGLHHSLYSGLHNSLYSGLHNSFCSTLSALSVCLYWRSSHFCLCWVMGAFEQPKGAWLDRLLWGNCSSHTHFELNQWVRWDHWEKISQTITKDASGLNIRGSYIYHHDSQVNTLNMNHLEVHTLTFIDCFSYCCACFT